MFYFLEFVNAARVFSRFYLVDWDECFVAPAKAGKLDECFVMSVAAPAKAGRWESVVVLFPGVVLALGM